MPRPPLPLGTWGRIRRDELGLGSWVARARFRDFDGRTRIVEARGRSGAAAERALTVALRDRATPGHGGDLNGDMRMGRLCARWLEEVEAGERVKPQTIDRSWGIVEFSIVPASATCACGR